MADGTYTPKVYRKTGGDTQVVASGGIVDVESGGEITVESGGEINIVAGGKITDDGTQAAAIAAITTTGTFSTGIAAKINAMRVALIGVGILATG